LREEALMTRDQIAELTRHWIDSWNARDLEAVLRHFEESARFTSPRAVAVMGRPTVEGNSDLRRYWQGRLALIQSLRFTLDRVLWDGEQRSLTIVYEAEIDGQRTRACEILHLGESDRAIEGEAMYGARL
jgi:ketosteroid isomerase-like protein